MLRWHMKFHMKKFLTLASREDGSTAVEYGLIAALLVVALVGAFQGAADSTTGLYGYMVKTIQAVTG